MLVINWYTNIYNYINHIILLYNRIYIVLICVYTYTLSLTNYNVHGSPLAVTRTAECGTQSQPLTGMRRRAAGWLLATVDGVSRHVAEWEKQVLD